MCGLTGILISNRRRSKRELHDIAGMFTRLLVGSEHRGPHATGAALIGADGNHIVTKAPVPASQFVTSRDYRQLINRVDDSTTCLMGHTRWPTRGSHLENANNHPLVSGGGPSVRGQWNDGCTCLITHNGHISNHEALSHALKLRREAQVDSEVILRLAERNLTQSGIDPVGLTEDLSLCRGKLSAVIVATHDPSKIFLVKGNQPLEARYHEGHGLIAYASEAQILDSAIVSGTGWEPIEIPPWNLVVVDTRVMIPLHAYPITGYSDANEGSPRSCR